MLKLKPSKYYQRRLQIVSRGSDVVLFLMGFFLGKEAFAMALIFLLLKVSIGFTVSELMYHRMKAVVREENNELKKECDSD